MGKIFEIKIFILKYGLDHSESIPTKKPFDQNFLSLPFFHPKWPKIEVFEDFWSNFFSNFFEFTSRTFYCGYFELSYLCVPLIFAELFPRDQIGPLLPLLHMEFMSLV